MLARGPARRLPSPRPGGRANPRAEEGARLDTDRFRSTERAGGRCAGISPLRDRAGAGPGDPGRLCVGARNPGGLGRSGGSRRHGSGHGAVDQGGAIPWSSVGRNDLSRRRAGHGGPQLGNAPFHRRVAARCAAGGGGGRSRISSGIERAAEPAGLSGADRDRPGSGGASAAGASLPGHVLARPAPAHRCPSPWIFASPSYARAICAGSSVA